MNNPLSQREIEVLALLLLGRNNKDIANGMRLSDETVKVHVKGILRKLNVNSRTEAVSVCLRSALRLPCPRCGHVDDGAIHG